jgi:hypothetical protein
VLGDRRARVRHRRVGREVVYLDDIGTSGCHRHVHPPQLQTAGPPAGQGYVPEARVDLDELRFAFRPYPYGRSAWLQEADRRGFANRPDAVAYAVQLEVPPVCLE